jgi:murein DD-endopeptidase MepM/ murein hydrolase activator NlpD
LTEQSTSDQITTKKNGMPTWLSWAGTFVIAGLLVSILFWQPRVAQSMADLTGGQTDPAVSIDAEDIPREALGSMLEFNVAADDVSLLRKSDTHTEVTSVLRQDVINYTVEMGDAIFTIAKEYNISPETLLWSNYDVLSDNPHLLSIGQTLRIPPTNGIWYEWQANDTLDSVAAKYKADVDDILLWFGNDLDITNPVIEPGTFVMIPDGQREFQQWVVPTIARGKAGVSTTILGPGSCDTSGYGAFGTGYFTWPASNHYLSGNDYWSGHLAIDIAAGTGAPIYAADSGMVVYAGAISGGYGNMVMIDHGNGYQTLYAHLSSIVASCGSSVYQGSVIGYAGSTGHSTGPHLHFEIRYMGGFINPWSVLP